MMENYLKMESTWKGLMLLVSGALDLTGLTSAVLPIVGSCLGVFETLRPR